MAEMLFQLLVCPEYLEPLREEAQTALERNGGWNEKALDSLPKLDSFIREVNRLWPTGAGRRLCIPIRLSTQLSIIHTSTHRFM